MKHVIIGTAGHIDHGKTSLIQALTGTNTDRLKEEQDRGMTIDLGFAALKLPDGNLAGIVDVPGHERFLKNMLAGATGVDVVLLVIAADEGIMPQTLEHLEILRLLDLKNGVVALTKCDVANREWVDVVEEDIRARLKGTWLGSAPVIRVSSVTGLGMAALKKALLSAVSRVEARNSALPARLPVDRVFTRPGFGTIVTGTLVAGALQLGDPVEIVPQMLETRVRGLQVHNEKVQRAEAGSRVAVNIAGVGVGVIARGAQLTAPSSVSPTNTIDAQFVMAATDIPPLRNRARVRLHIGTDEIIGRLVILEDKKQLMPGDNSFVQFQGETMFAALRGDRLIFRLYSPMITVGGGQVLNSSPSRHKSGSVSLLQSLEAMLNGTPTDLVRTALSVAEYGRTLTELQSAAGIATGEVDEALRTLVATGEVVKFAKDRFASVTRTRTLLDRAITALQRYHDQFPLRSGMQKEELREMIARSADVRVFTALISLWEADGRVKTDSGLVRLTDFQVQLNDRQLGLLGRIEEYYVEKGIAVPTVQEVSLMVRAPADAVSALLKVGAERGNFHYVADGTYYAAATIESSKAILKQFLQSHDFITVGQFRDLTGSNRKFALQALEYLDTIRFTRRQGDNRTLA